MNKVQLTKNLRRDILRGHPWVYKDSVKVTKDDPNSWMAEVLDSKGKALGWAICDKNSPLFLRILSLEKKPPNEKYIFELFEQAVQRRSFLDFSQINAYRLSNGEGDRLPGFVCDVYDDVAVVQFDGDGCKKFWSQYPLVEWLKSRLSLKTVVDKTRGGFEKLWGEDLKDFHVIKENGLSFAVDIKNGQKTGFFLDQRDNREYVRSIAKGKTVMNLFSYTGGFSIYAGAGGAVEVASVDLAKPALKMAEISWELNQLPKGNHTSMPVDIFKFIQEDSKLWDMIIVDPPSMAHALKQKEIAKKKYVELFALAARKLAPGGDLILSSCSSQISFEDFMEVITEALSVASTRAIVLRVSGQGADHPFPHILPEMRYLKFAHLKVHG